MNWDSMPIVSANTTMNMIPIKLNFRYYWEISLGKISV